jgi:hypothetical protein
MMMMMMMLKVDILAMDELRKYTLRYGVWVFWTWRRHLRRRHMAYRYREGLFLAFG